MHKNYLIASNAVRSAVFIISYSNSVVNPVENR
jgi:hypothetical protein